MSISLEAKQKNIFEIFNIQQQYNIPAYQRPYSWGFDECYMLYLDLTEAYENDEDYFLGNIILASSKDLATSSKLDVIDGQQRLTSLLLILKILNLLYPTHKGPEKCLWLDSLETDDKYIRLESKIIELAEEEDNLKKSFGYGKDNLENKRDRLLKGFEIDVKKLEAISSDQFLKNILTFYFLFDSYFKNKGNHSENLSGFINFLLKKVSLLPIELQGGNKEEATEKALRIFETINNRGLNLSDSDIFKSKLFILTEDKARFGYSWSELIERAESLGVAVNDLFRYYSHIIRGQEGIVSGEINLREFFTVKDYSPLKTKSFDSIMQDLNEICDLLEQWQSKKINDTSLSRWLHLIDIYTNSFPKYAIMAYLFKNGFDDELEKFLIYLVKFIYSKGSTTYIKWDIYPLIYKITSSAKHEYSADVNIILTESLFTGRLKKGFVFMAYYLNGGNYSNTHKVGRVFSVRDGDDLKVNWQIDDDALNSKLASLANYLVYESTSELKIKKEELKESLEGFKQRESEQLNLIEDFLRS